MAPVQPNDPKSDSKSGDKKKMSLDQVVAALGKQGIEIDGLPDAPKEMSMEDKVRHTR